MFGTTRFIVRRRVANFNKRREEQKCQKRVHLFRIHQRQTLKSEYLQRKPVKCRISDSDSPNWDPNKHVTFHVIVVAAKTNNATFYLIIIKYL